MQNKQLPTNSSTQEIIQISDIRDDMLILKDGTIRAVLMVSSINFALKNQDEQESIINAYNYFLNSISYPIQISIQSRALDIDEYILKLQQLAKQQTNELLRMQTLDYVQFVQELLVGQSIMSKKFFIIVPYSSVGDTKKGFFYRMTNVFSPNSVIKLKIKQLKEYKEQLMRRIIHIQGGLETMGLQSVMLDTASLIELFYNCYNPDLSKRQKLKDIDKITIEE